MARDYDVIIAGAGPAGAAAAARLLRLEPRLRERILVLDRYRFPRPKPCGGGLTGHADEALAAAGLALEVPHWPSPRARVRFGAFERTVDLGRPVNVVRREDFDANLVDQVRRLGIEVIEGEGVKGYDDAAERLTVHTSKGRALGTRVLIGADGAASVVRKQLLGNPRELPHRLFKLEMALPAGDRPDDAMLYDFTPMVHGLRGYLWIFPVPGNLVNVGVMHYPAYRKSGVELTDLLRRGLAEHGLELPARGTRGWPVWGYRPGQRIAAPRVLTVGDAAGIDGLTGEGIAVAMEQAVVAADMVCEAFASGDLSFARYRRRIRGATVGRELALDRWLARLLYGSRRLRKSWLSLVLYDPDVLEMYAARVSGSEVLADQKVRLYRALMRHIVRLPARRRALTRAAAGASVPLLPAADQA